MRSTKEWIGKTDDAKVPDYVRLRVFDRADGVCHLSGRKIRAGEKWELEHVVAISNGGEHRESNLSPALADPHKEKTRLDRKEKATRDRKRKKFLGMKNSKHPMPGSKASPWKRRMDGTIERRGKR